MKESIEEYRIGIKDVSQETKEELRQHEVHEKIKKFTEWFKRDYEIANDFVVEGRCSGHCCNAFVLGNGIDAERMATLLETEGVRYDNLADENEGYDDPLSKELVRVCRKIAEDHRTAFNMLLVKGKVTPGSASVLGIQENVPDDGVPRTYYTCKHWNKTTGDCMNYENRPWFCRSHPFWQKSGKCNYEGCTLKVYRKNPADPNIHDLVNQGFYEPHNNC